jgi:hypothetical protein
MIDFKKDVLLGCILVRDLPGGNPEVPNSAIEQCPECHQDIWVGPRFRKMRDANINAKTICYPCIIEENIRLGGSVDDFELVEINKIN